MHVSFRRIFSLMLICLLLLVSLAGCGDSVKEASTSYKENYQEGADNQGDEDYSQDLYQDDQDSDSDLYQNGQDSGSDFDQNNQDSETDDRASSPSLDKNGNYTSKEDVADYLIEYGELPQNFITKKEARKLGWHGGSLEPYAPGKCIGGDHFGNYEGNLPEVDGRSYYECDIDTLGAKSRGAKRIVYSDDGQIYYTDDHYETFTLLYGDDEK